MAAGGDGWRALLLALACVDVIGCERFNQPCIQRVFGAFDHRQAVAALIVLDLVHNVVNEQDAAPRSPEEIGRVERVWDVARVEALALVFDGEARFSGGEVGGDAHYFRRVVLVAVLDGVDESLVERDEEVGAFRLDDAELRAIVEKTLSYKLRFVEDVKVLPYVREHIEFELPSDLSLMNGVLHYLLERVAKLGLIKPERSNLFVALDEAFVNAVKHGNRNDPTKMVRITAELSASEARFTVEDEGEGFNVQEIPDPCDPANLFKTSGRGVLLIYNIMDEVKYNERGNRLTMIKRPEDSLDTKLIESFTPEDDKRIRG